MVMPHGLGRNSMNLLVRSHGGALCRDGKNTRARGYSWIKFVTDSYYPQIFIIRG